MTDHPKNAIAILTLESLAFLQRKKDEVEALVDTTTRTDELVVYLFLIEKLRNDTLRDAHMATMSHRLDEMQRTRKEDHEIVAACMRDNALAKADLVQKTPEELQQRRARTAKRITLPRYRVMQGTRRNALNDRLDRWYVVDTNDDDPNAQRKGEGLRTRREARAEQRRLERGE